jgi:hypothetical protein
MGDPKFQIFLLAIVPALIAGGFSIAPKLYDLVSEPRAELTYAINMGPDLVTDTLHQQIASIDVKNAGRKPLTEIEVIVRSAKGKLDAARIQNQSDLKTSLKSSPQATTVDVPRMLPAEHFSMSVMLSSEGDPGFSISARSDEVLGVRASERDDTSSFASEYLGSGLAGMSVFVMMLVAARRGISLGTLGGDKQDALHYIVARCQLPEIESALRLYGKFVTYLRMADILLAYGLRSTGDELTKTVNALKCLLLIKDMAKGSREIVVRNLRILQKTRFSEASVAAILKRSVPVHENLGLRDRIDEIIEHATDGAHVGECPDTHVGAE